MEAMAADELSQVMAKLNVENYKSAVQYVKFLYNQQQNSAESALHIDPMAQHDPSPEERKKLVFSLAGLWQDHDNNLPVEEYVRNMRKGRTF